MVPEPGMPSVSSGTNEPGAGGVVGGLRCGQTLDRALAEFLLFLALGDVAFHRIAKEGRDGRPCAGQDADKEALQGLPPDDRRDACAPLRG